MSEENEVPPRNIVDLDLLHDPVEELKALHAAVANLATMNINVARFSRADIHNMRMTIGMYCKEVRILQNLDNPELLRNVWLAAIKADVAVLPDEATPNTVLKFARWLKKGKGAKVLSDAQHLIKLQKKAVGAVPTSVLAFAQLLEQQGSDMIAERKRIQAETQAKIDALRKQIQAAENEGEILLKRSARKFKPFRDYVPPTKAELDGACWDAFTDRFLKVGKPAPEWNIVMQEQASTRYANVFMNEHRQEFCRIPSNQVLLKSWGAVKVQQLATGQEFRRSREVERILGLASGDQVTTSASGSKSASRSVHSDGKNTTTEPGADEHSTNENSVPRSPEPATPVGGEASAPSKKRKRKKRQHEQSADEEPKNTSTKRPRRSKRQRDPHRKE